VQEADFTEREMALWPGKTRHSFSLEAIFQKRGPVVLDLVGLARAKVFRVRNV
jgi:hypothetical protein